jgi:hypothetical protein
VGCTFSAADEDGELTAEEMIDEVAPTTLDDDTISGVDDVAGVSKAALELGSVEEPADNKELTIELEEDELAAGEDEAAGPDDKATDDDPLEATELLESITLLDAVLPVHFPNPA